MHSISGYNETELLACVWRGLVPEGRSCDRLLVEQWLGDSATTTGETERQLVTQLVQSVRQRGRAQTENLFPVLHERLNTQEWSQLLMIASAGLELNGFPTSDLDSVLPFVPDDDDEYISDLCERLRPLIYEEDRAPVGRQGILLRLRVDGAKKLDLLLVEPREVALWRECLARWAATSVETRDSVLLAKLQVYARGGIHYRVFKWRLYRFLLPELTAWFPECTVGQMCCALQPRPRGGGGAIVTRSDWPCPRRRQSQAQMFCAQHQAEHAHGQTPPHCVSSEWLASAGLCGTIVALCGPSCVGKSKVSDFLRADEERGRCARSVTTRDPRTGECAGDEYFFESHEQFEARVTAGHFFEHSRIYENHYGKLWTELLPPLLTGQRLYLSLHQDTVHHYRERLPVRTLALYLVPPSQVCLSARVQDRLAQGGQGDTHHH